MTNIMTKILTYDHEEYLGAHERKDQRQQAADEAKAEVTRQLNLKRNTPEQDASISEHLNDLRSQYREIQNIEHIMRTDINRYYDERLDQRLLQLKST